MLFMHSLNVLVLLALGSPDGASVRGLPDASPIDTISSAKASGPRCVVAVKADTVNVKVTNASRKACLPMAQLIEPGVPHASDDNLRAGPPSDFPLGADADIHCRLQPRPESGGSLKFRCMRTNAQGQLYDGGGDLVPSAVRVDAGGDLLDAQGMKVLDEDGKPREGDELRVK